MLETDDDVVWTGFLWLITGTLLNTWMTSRFP